MLTLRQETFDRAGLPVSTSWLLADCMEFRSKQDLSNRQRPEVLEALRQQAMIQSVESSNRIEGVTVSPDRLAPLAIGKARPRDRSEEDLSTTPLCLTVFSGTGLHALLFNLRDINGTNC